MSRTDFVYVTYIRTTPEKLWQALTERRFIVRYFGGGGPESDWGVGSPVRWKMDAADSVHDWGQRVLESEPSRRLAYSWHNYWSANQRRRVHRKKETALGCRIR
jgi:uncharacterized protein YndB with AHSA1/START domain